MRIVIDMQGAQSEGSRNRGIGRYTLWLAQAMARSKGSHEIMLALNGSFPETIPSIRAAFEKLLPEENIRIWYFAGPLTLTEEANNVSRKTAEQARESFLAELDPDMVLISSLFEGLEDNAVTSVKTLCHNVPTASILYDLIPHIHASHYLTDPVTANWYKHKLDHMRRVDLALAISESSKEEGIHYLGFNETNCTSISAAINPQFQPRQIAMDEETRIRHRYKLHRPFVMYLGGVDPRKNVDGLIRAYAGLPQGLRANHQLAIVYAIPSHDLERMKQLANKHGLKNDEIVFSGFIPDDDLIVIYNLCKLFVFPSWHEGFGLPALEAMTCGRAVIGANRTSLPEVIGHENALFDPYSDQAITEKMEQVLTDEALRTELEQHGLKRAKQFSWDISAQRALAAIAAKHAELSSKKPSSAQQHPRSTRV